MNSFRFCLIFAFSLLVLLVPGLQRALAQGVVISAARVVVAAKATRFEANMSANAVFNAATVAKPYRVIIDIADASFDFPTGAGRKTSGLVTSFRYGLVEAGKSRIVLDVSGPVKIVKAKVIPAKGKKPATMVVELLPTTLQNFKTSDAAVPQKAQDIQTAAISAAPSVPPEPAAAPIHTIVIDAGHGGIDPGALSANHTKEKEVVLDYALTLRNLLQANPSYKVVLTRDSDKFISLEDRVKIARDHKADLFIAVHADTVNEASVRGTTLYTVSNQATDAEAEALAQKENRADVIGGIDLGNQTPAISTVLIDLAQRESKMQAMYFAKKAVQELQPIAHFTGKPVRSAAFVVLKAPDVPSILVELGYLSNANDEAMLKAPAWRNSMAAAMTRAVDDYFGALATIVSSN
ncbi:MAG: N-acetylmuramoyl-L-alanine amidase [Alphaproteobacteria bacterium]|nr:N-acetylmuramoyl-L-alanine amidase [Alphaproteobacteria bacterium]